MSHVAKLEIEVKDLDALRKAAETLGLELRQDQKTYKWWGYSVGDYPLPEGFKEKDLGKCDHALSLKDNPNAYEVGVVKNKDGRPGYTLLWDFYGGGYGLQKAIGKDGNFLKQQYAKEVAKKKIPFGFKVTEKVVNNKIVLHAVRG